MASEHARVARLGFGMGLALRALLLAGLLLLATFLFTLTGYVATGTLIALIALGVAVELFRYSFHADRTFAQAVDGIVAGSLTMPVRATHPELTTAIERALQRIARERSAASGRPEYFQALCDNVPVALFTIEDQKPWQPVNRAAWKLAGADGMAAIVNQLGLEGIELVQNLVPGRQSLFRLQDSGLRMLANTARWTADGQTRTLVALLPVDHLLDRVETQAWQDLARILAHEMMNSLTPITSLAANVRPMLEQLGRTPEQKAATVEIGEALETIERRSLGLMRFVENYRSVSETPVAASQMVDLDELVERTLRLVSEQYHADGIAITHRRGSPPLRARADPALLEQALINLVKNARDAVGGVATPLIEVQTGDADGEAIIAVRDNGVGIDEALTVRAFVPFYTTKAGGSGIGLTLARQIVLAHGGKIEIASTPGTGTVVTVRLPAVGGMDLSR